MKKETFIEEDTRYKKHCTQDNDASVSFKVVTLKPHTVLPIARSRPIVFSWISSTIWNLFLFKGDFSFGKSQKSQGTESGLEGGWVTWMFWCFSKTLGTRRDAGAGALSWWSCRTLVTHICSLLHHLKFLGRNVLERKLNAKSDAYLLLYALSHFECNSHTVHMLTQWHLPPPLTSTVKSSFFTHGHSIPLSLAARLHWCHANHSCYINNGWTFSGQTSYTS